MSIAPTSTEEKLGADKIVPVILTHVEQLFFGISIKLEMGNLT